MALVGDVLILQAGNMVTLLSPNLLFKLYNLTLAWEEVYFYFFGFHTNGIKT